MFAGHIAITVVFMGPNAAIKDQGAVNLKELGHRIQASRIKRSIKHAEVLEKGSA